MGMRAEQDAEVLVSQAKKNRQTRLKQAKEKAEAELKTFQDEQEQKFQRDFGAKARADPHADLHATTQREAEAVRRDYQANKDRTINFIVQKVLDVPTSL